MRAIPVTEKRRFIKREAAPEPEDIEAEPTGQANSPADVRAAVDAGVNDVIKSVAASSSSLLNGHTTVGSQPKPSEETADHSVQRTLVVKISQLFAQL